MKYGLEINNITYGETSAVAVDAEGELADGVLTLVYRFDEADYVLIISEKQITQERRGGVNIFMRVAEEGRSYCTLRDENGEGTMEIEAGGISVCFDGLSCKAECRYRFVGGEEETRLTVRAIAIA
ncbi:MAG: hypothetical protein K2L72_04905 [Clostridia bacterium]|nr:hypothetical protein [Clostridia bacterium]